MKTARKKNKIDPWKITRKRMNVEIAFQGCNGKVLREENTYSGGVIYSGGVPSPQALHPRRKKPLVEFNMYREALNAEGYYSPPYMPPPHVWNSEPVVGAFQINITSNSQGFRELGQYFLAIAELDTTDDSGYHQHNEGIISEDGRTRLHIIIRKNRM